MAFKLFHGRDGVVPLSGKSYMRDENVEPEPALQFNPLAAKAATISLSAFGLGGPFGFDFFSNKWKKQMKRSSKNDPSQVALHHLNIYLVRALACYIFWMLIYELGRTQLLS